MGPLLAMAVLPAAASGVHVEDDRACLDAEAIELEVRSTVGDRAVDELDLFARLDGGEAPWRLRLEVVDGEDVLWRKAIEVEPVDCPYLPALVARSVEQGLAEVPGWGVAVEPERLPAESSLRVVFTGPTPLRLGLGVARGLGISGRARWFVHGELFGSGVQGVGEGGGRLLGATLGTGPWVDLPLGAGAVRLGAEVTGGPVLAWGSGFDRIHGELVPRMAITGGAMWVSRWWFQAGVRAEVPVVRVAVVDEGSGVRSAEPGVRVGLVLAARIQ